MNKKEMQKELEKIWDDGEYDKTPDLVKVVWKDAHTSKITLNYEDITKEGITKAWTIGYLMYENDEHIAVCGFLFPDYETNIDEIAGETGFREVHFIPKCLIEHIIVLGINIEKTKKINVKEDVE